MSDHDPQHKFEFDQLVKVIDANYPSTVQVVAKIHGPCCSRHSAPYYGCVAGNDHFTLCEAMLQPLTLTEKRKMN